MRFVKLTNSLRDNNSFADYGEDYLIDIVNIQTIFVNIVNIQIIFEDFKYNYTKCILSWNVYIFKEVANGTSSLLILATKPTTTDDHHL